MAAVFSAGCHSLFSCFALGYAKPLLAGWKAADRRGLPQIPSIPPPPPARRTSVPDRSSEFVMYGLKNEIKRLKTHLKKSLRWREDTSLVMCWNSRLFLCYVDN